MQTPVSNPHNESFTNEMSNLSLNNNYADMNNSAKPNEGPFMNTQYQNQGNISNNNPTMNQIPMNNYSTNHQNNLNNPHLMNSGYDQNCTNNAYPNNSFYSTDKPEMNSQNFPTQGRQCWSNPQQTNMITNTNQHGISAPNMNPPYNVGLPRMQNPPTSGFPNHMSGMPPQPIINQGPPRPQDPSVGFQNQNHHAINQNSQHGNFSNTPVQGYPPMHGMLSQDHLSSNVHNKPGINNNPIVGQPNFNGPPMPQVRNGYQQPGMHQGFANQSRISSDQLPNVLEVIADDMENQNSIIFDTSKRGETPPLVTTNFTCRDGGNCNPRFIRSSLYNVPNTSDMLNQIGVNFTLTCSPFANLKSSDSSVIISDMGSKGPVRCIRCKAYMNPYNLFVDGGRKFQCALCTATSEVPDSYFAHVDHTGRRTDSLQRPELCLGSYELYATKEYCRKNILPKAPAYIFLLDVSQPSIKSGFLKMFCSRFVSEILPNLPKPELSKNQKEQWLMANPGKEDFVPNHIDIPISFITYGSQLNFFSFVTAKHYPNGPDSEPISITKPQMHIVADTDDMFVPGVNGFLTDSSNVETIQELMNIIPSLYIGETVGPNSHVTLLGPAIQAGMESLKASDRPGKLFIFHTCLPTVEGPGRLKNREDSKIIGTDKEKTLLIPADNFYTELGQKCVQNGCSVDYFLMPTSYVDIATLSEVPRLTGGRIYKYPCFQADRQGDDLINDLALAITLPQAFDCVMKVRTSTGTRPVDFLCNAHIPNSTDIEVAAVDSDWGLTVEIKHDDKLGENEIVIIQLAVLFTSLSGERRLRIHNLTLNTSNKPLEIFLSADLDTFINYLAKLCIKGILNKQRQVIFDELTHKVCNSLAAYKKLCCNTNNNAFSSNPGELILPEKLKLLPYFVQSFFKTPIIKSGSACQMYHNDPHAASLLTRQLGTNEIGLDTRSLTLFHINRMDVLQTATYFYPRVYPLHNLKPEEDSIPELVRCSMERFKSDGAYLVDNGGFNRFLWIGNDLSQNWLLNVFNVDNPRSIPDGAILTEHPNELSRRINQVVRYIGQGQTRSARLIVARQNTEQEVWMKMFMLEDRASDNTPSYGDYLIHIHKEIRSIVK